MILFLLACTGANEPASSPMPTVSDPRAYVRDAILGSEMNFTSESWINPDDPALFDPWLDKKVKGDILLKGELPTNSSKLDRFIKRNQTSYLSHVLSTEEGRAAVEQRIRERFENPAMSMLDDGTALADLGWAPAKLVEGPRTGWQLGESPVFDRGEVATEHLVRAFKQVHDAHPQANGWRLKVQQYNGISTHRFTYFYDAARDMLLVRYDTELLQSADQLGGVEKLLEGGYATHSSELVNAQAEWNLLP